MESANLCLDRLAYLLCRKGLKQKQLASLLGVTDNMPSYWIHGRRLPSIEQLVAMSQIFSVSVDYLLGLSDAPLLHPTLVDELGLSDRAVGRLRDIARDPNRKGVFQKLFESDELYNLIDILGRE